MMRFLNWLFESTAGGWVLCCFAFVVVVALILGSASGIIAFYENVVQPSLQGG